MLKSSNVEDGEERGRGREGGGGESDEGAGQGKAEEEVGEEQGEEDAEGKDDDDEEEGDSEEDEEENEEEVGIGLQLPQRATRGHAYQRLIGEALEEDQAFWGHNTWADEEEDADYNCSEGEEVYADVIDPDFDQPEEDEGGSSGGEGGCSRGRKRGERPGRAGEKKKRHRRGERDSEEDADVAERKPTRKAEFDLMWRRQQAKRKREKQQRREEEKKRQAKRRMLRHKEEKQDGRERAQRDVEDEEKEEERERGNDEECAQRRRERQELPSVETRRQLRVTRGRRLGKGDGSSTSDEQEENTEEGSKSSSRRSEQRNKKAQKTRKPKERAAGASGVMTLEEHLKEARRTEERNMAVLLELEERDEARRLRHVFDLKKNMYAGDYDRYFSWASWLVVGDQAAEDEPEAATGSTGATAADTTAAQQQQQQEAESKQHQLLQPCGEDEKAARLLWGSSHVQSPEGANAAAPGGERKAGCSQREGVQETSAAEGACAAAGAGLMKPETRETAAAAARAPRKMAAPSRCDGGGAFLASGVVEAGGRDSGCGGRDEVQKAEGKEKGEKKTLHYSEGDGDAAGLSKALEGTDNAASPRSSQQQPPFVQPQQAPLVELQQLPLVEPHKALLSGQVTELWQEQQKRENSRSQLLQAGEEQHEMQPHTAGTHATTASSTREGAEKAAKGDIPGVERYLGKEGQEEAIERDGYAMELRMFTDGKFPDIYTQQPLPPPPPHPRCLITGQRAKYREPSTGAPFATVHAFECLRREFRRMREQHLLQLMQQLKAPDPGRNGGLKNFFCLSKEHASGFGSPPPMAASGSPAAAAGVAAGVHEYLLFPDTSRRGTDGSRARRIDYSSLIAGGRGAETANFQQERQRKVKGEEHTASMKRNIVSGTVITSLAATSPNETAFPAGASGGDAVQKFLDSWTACGGVTEQKRRRPARNTASCGRKGINSRAPRKT